MHGSSTPVIIIIVILHVMYLLKDFRKLDLQQCIFHQTTGRNISKRFFLNFSVASVLLLKAPWGNVYGLLT